MKNLKIMKTTLAVVSAILLTACAQNNAGETQSSEAQKTEVQKTEVQSQESIQTEEQNTQAAEVTVPATVIVKCAYENGTPDIVEYFDISDVTDQPSEDGHIINGYDAAGNLVYKREDSSSTDDNGIVNVTITYDFYSLEHNFDFSIQPLEPENGGNIQTLNGSIVVRNESGETSKDFTFETVGFRGQTGIWYAGICSCRDGVLGDYIAE